MKESSSSSTGAVPEALVFDALAWLGNVSTSVLIVFVNKVLMDPKKGYRFSFGTYTKH